MYYFCNVTTTWLAQLDKCQFAKQEVTGSNPGRTNTQGLKITDPSGVVQPFLAGWVMKGLISNWTLVLFHPP